jgi:Rad3-related DNA helicase
LPRSIIESFNLTDYEYLNIPSSFSPSQRPAIWIPAANLARSAENPGMELKKLTTAVDAILDKFPEQKGMIHTVNYKISQFLMKNSKNVNRFRTHESAAERSDVLEKFKRNNDNGVLVSPSFTEGVDLPYDLCRFQIIAKIPYESLANPQVKARMEVDNQWYATNAIVTMIQAYGRAMRAEDDQGITYILDSSLMNLINRWRTVFDNMTYFLDALWIMDESKLIPFSEFDAKPKLTRRKRY